METIPQFLYIYTPSVYICRKSSFSKYLYIGTSNDINDEGDSMVQNELCISS